MLSSPLHSIDLCEAAISNVPPLNARGQLDRIQGLITATLSASLGELVEIQQSDGTAILAEVIGFSDDSVQLMPFAPTNSLKRGDAVQALGREMRVPVGFELLGRVINSIGEPIDDKGPLNTSSCCKIQLAPPSPLSRNPIKQVFTTGQKAIDGLLTIGQGQRVGLFAGSGVGKSTLLGQIARYADADLNVVALIGERGREVLPFIQESLGKEGIEKSVVLVSTANESPLARVRAAESAVSIANWYRQRGKNVFLMLDSLTRFAMAQRDLGLMLGEPPTSRGYTPSVFQKLAVLLEQLGNSDRGSITGLLTILVDADDMNDPIADAARSILDGHIVLDRNLANAGHFPAIDILQSASRLFQELVAPAQLASAIRTRKLLALYQDVIDLVQVGAYTKGVSPQTDLAIAMYPEICDFLTQDLGTPSNLKDTQNHLAQLVGQAVGEPAPKIQIQ